MRDLNSKNPFNPFKALKPLNLYTFKPDSMCPQPKVSHLSSLISHRLPINYLCHMHINCTDKELFLLKTISAAAEELGTDAYLVGGFVRDKLLGRSTVDADIVCLGTGVQLAHAVARRFQPSPTVSFFKNFGTAHIRLNLAHLGDSDQSVADEESQTGYFDVEFVGARKESYQPDSRKPQVATGTLEDDQLRRDFTINALAISLRSEDYGELVDPFNGIGDLEAKLIRTPRDPIQTFSDDPLRMMRAIRFATQL